MDASKKNFYFLISGSVVFVNQPDTVNENIGSIQMNGVLISDINSIPARSLGKAQQILQINFMKQMGQSAPKIVDVSLHNFVLLGEFTHDEFHQAPEGMELKKVDKKPELKVVKTDEVVKDEQPVQPN